MRNRDSALAVAALVLTALFLTPTGDWLWCQSTPSAQAPAKPLPELNSFLQGIRKNLHSDRLLLSRYTYIEKDADRHVDKEGQVRKTEEAVYEVYPSVEERLTYRRLISKNGNPVKAEELEEKDREHDRLIQEKNGRLKVDGDSTWAKRLTRQAEAKREEERTIDELFRLYDITLVGRKTVEGQIAIALAFQPQSNYRAQTREGKILEKIAGRAWFGEQDYQLIRVEAELIDNVSIGLGMLARFNKGAKAVLQRRRINDEIWLPAESHFSGTARFLLFKGLRIDASSEYSDYKKFSVETSVDYRTGKNQ
jgi:hypothetical protein